MGIRDTKYRIWMLLLFFQFSCIAWILKCLWITFYVAIYKMLSIVEENGQVIAVKTWPTSSIAMTSAPASSKASAVPTLSFSAALWSGVPPHCRACQNTNNLRILVWSCIRFLLLLCSTIYMTTNTKWTKEIIIMPMQTRFYCLSEVIIVAIITQLLFNIQWAHLISCPDIRLWQQQHFYCGCITFMCRPVKGSAAPLHIESEHYQYTNGNIGI